MEQAEGGDLAGLDRRGAGLARHVHPVGETPDPGPIRDDQIATKTDERTIDRVPIARLAPDVELAIHQLATTSGGRAAATCSIARRRSSNPDGSKS